MGQKRNKIVVGLRGFIPKAINFSELKKEQRREDFTSEVSKEVELSDNGLAIEEIEKTVEFEELIAQMLFNLEGNERFIFLYQLLREFGYQIDHGTFAKTLKINRQRYMDILGNIRVKTYLMVHGYRRGANGTSKQIETK
jgi:hypothetical protein